MGRHEPREARTRIYDDVKGGGHKVAFRRIDALGTYEGKREKIKGRRGREKEREYTHERKRAIEMRLLGFQIDTIWIRAYEGFFRVFGKHESKKGDEDAIMRTGESGASSIETRISRGDVPSEKSSGCHGEPRFILATVTNEEHRMSCIEANETRAVMKFPVWLAKINIHGEIVVIECFWKNGIKTTFGSHNETIVQVVCRNANVHVVGEGIR